MNNFKGGGFKKGGNKFGNKPKFSGGGDRRSGGGNKFGNSNDRSDRNDRPSANSEKFSATCTECHKSCEVPFKPSGDKPVYCSDCFTKRLSEEKKGKNRGGGDHRSESPKPPREQRSPRHDASRGQNDMALSNMQRQLANLEEKLNRVLEIINPPMPSAKVPLVTSDDTPKKERKAKKVAVVKAEPKKLPRKASAKKTPKIPAVKVPAKPKTQKVAAKKTVVKKVAKKAPKKAVVKKAVVKKTKAKKGVKK